MEKTKTESAAAKAIRDSWRIVLNKNRTLQGKLRPGRVGDDALYDGEMDQAWFESQNGLVEIFQGVELFTFEESEKCCLNFVRDPSLPADVTNRSIFSRPVGKTESGDLIILYTIGRGNFYGKIAQLTQAQIAGIHIGKNFNVTSSYDPVNVAIDKAAKWIRTTFGNSK